VLSCAGNFFFAGARTFFRSLESAVFLFRCVPLLFPAYAWHVYMGLTVVVESDSEKMKPA
jgi:hypothetical protein